MSKKRCLSTVAFLIFLLSGVFNAFGDVTELPIYQKDKVGVIVIDVQSYYLPWAKDKDIDQTVERIGKVMELAGKYRLPFYMTLEYATWRPPSEHADHIKIPDRLQAVYPTVNSENYLKTGFDASRQPELIKDLRVAGLEKLVVVGAETDVCVIQTVMGLVRKGFEVYLVEGGVYTSEANERPSFLRMTQSGVKLISTEHFEQVLANNEPITADIEPELPPVHSNPYGIIEPVETAILLVDFVQPALDLAVNKSMQPMLDRAFLMFHETETYKRPIYSVIDKKKYGTTALPEKFFKTQHYKEYVRKGKSAPAARSIRGFDKMLENRNLKQVYLAGMMDGEYLRTTVEHLLTLDIQVYIIQDLIFSAETTILKDIEAMYKKGAIPMTLKMFKYGMAKGVSPDECFSHHYLVELWSKYGQNGLPYIDSLPPVFNYEDEEVKE